MINPNGITFGNNARLNLPGSFVASTAESVLFEGDIEFSAANPMTAPLLTISAPIGLQVGSDPGDLAINTRPLGINAGETLALLGGNITLNRGRIDSPATQVELASVSNGIIGLEPGWVVR